MEQSSGDRVMEFLRSQRDAMVCLPGRMAQPRNLPSGNAQSEVQAVLTSELNAAGRSSPLPRGHFGTVAGHAKAQTPAPRPASAGPHRHRGPSVRCRYCPSGRSGQAVRGPGVFDMKAGLVQMGSLPCGA